MVFDGSAIARSTSAEYIAASRHRTRSLSNPGAHPSGKGALGCEPHDPASPPLLISPAPVYGIPRKEDALPLKSPPSPSPTSRKRTLTGLSSRSARTAQPTIPEDTNEDVEAQAFSQQPAADDNVDRSGNESLNTMDAGSDRDAERGFDQQPIVGEPIYVQQQREKREKQKKDKVERESIVKEEKDPFLVTLEGRPHLNPHTWNSTYRWVITGFAGLLVFNASFASSAPSQLVPAIDAYFDVSEEVGTLLIALFVAGYCVGPLLWGYGRI